MLKANQSKFLEAATVRFGDQAVVAARDLSDFAKANKFSNADHGWIFKAGIVLVVRCISFPPTSRILLLLLRKLLWSLWLLKLFLFAKILP